MSTKTLIIENEAALHQLAAQLAPLLVAGDVVCLKGGLGAGKTSFSRGLIAVLAGEAVEVPSPTFTLVQAYEGLVPPIWHLDLYRLTRERDILELGWEEGRRFAALLVEWPERLGGFLPADRLEIDISFAENAPTGRIVTLSAFGAGWQSRIGHIK